MDLIIRFTEYITRHGGALGPQKSHRKLVRLRSIFRAKGFVGNLAVYDLVNSATKMSVKVHKNQLLCSIKLLIRS